MHPQLAHLGVAFNWFQPWGDYKVLGTDYENYTIINSSSRLLRTNWVWVLTRKPLKIDSPEWREIKEKAGAILTEKLPGVDQSSFRNTIQSTDECRYLLPVEQTGIVLPYARMQFGEKENQAMQ